MNIKKANKAFGVVATVGTNSYSNPSIGISASNLDTNSINGYLQQYDDISDVLDEAALDALDLD